MSWCYAQQVIWTCDGCWTWEPGYQGAVPDRWTTSRVTVCGHDGEELNEIVRHYCPACQQPETRP